MNHCKHHPDQPAVGFCKNCQSHICKKCVIVVEGKKRCRSCYEQALVDRMVESQKMAKLECKYCGNQIDSDSKFCSKCGNELEAVAGETTPPEQKPENIPKTNSLENHLSHQSQDSSAPPKKSTLNLLSVPSTAVNRHVESVRKRARGPKIRCASLPPP